MSENKASGWTAKWRSAFIIIGIAMIAMARLVMAADLATFSTSIELKDSEFNRLGIKRTSRSWVAGAIHLGGWVLLACGIVPACNLNRGE